MKKFLLITATIILCLLITACSSEKDKEENEKEDNKTEDVSKPQDEGQATPDVEEPDVEEPYEPEASEEPIEAEPQTYTLTVEGITFENGTSTLTLAPDEEYTIVAGNREKAAFLYFTDGNGTIITHKNTLPVKMAQNLYIKAVYAEMGEGELEFNTEDGKTYYVAGIGSVAGDTVIIPETFNGKPVDKVAITAFKDNISLKKVVIPDSVTSVGKEAFAGCTSLEYINIPSTVKDFDFSDIKNYPLKVLSVGIDLPEDFTSPTLEAIFVNEGVTTVSLKYSSNLRYASLPTTLKFIPDEAFKGCSSLTKISIPAGVEKIGKNAFQSCSSLLSVKFSEGLREIGEWAFDECSSLRALSFPSTLTKIKPYAFRMCKSVQTISFAEGLKTVDEAAFF
ncbi:MAG: leucine-rich repeat domain-containing protein, partial [Clostridia bacterium]|nr:leucine-rich repeat domain-containing protein [Clostridia bacterium]